MEKNVNTDDQSPLELDYEKILMDVLARGYEFMEYYLKEEWEKAERKGIASDDFKKGCVEMLSEMQGWIMDSIVGLYDPYSWNEYGIEAGDQGNFISLYEISLFNDVIKKIAKEKKGAETTPPRPTPPKWKDFHLLRPIFVERFQEDHYNNLKQYFTPQEEFCKFVFGEPFSFPINFNGTQNQFACLFKKLKEDGEVHFPASNEKTAIYLHSAFVFKKKFGRSLVRYFTGKTPINPDDCIDSAI
ncbi:hypothetical protein [Draconibacterium sediminis]|uniref:Uncharacterized protein n=1 Tax=Draconibacterium sediminis TaxID=1544798 RepID=A0A0D8JF68_9BACT|nr:hypothetical protein [Draconibacterium sediminis]KJF45359.1 hypothetical protein LH29_08290 [Draconibacterium sediminis]